MKIAVFTAIAALGLGLIGCNPTETRKDPKDLHKNVKAAYVVLSATQGNQVSGKVSFTVVDQGVKIVADVDGLTPGDHGFHVHEHGDCSAHDASSAGGHFNPFSKKHGGPNDAERHAGDFGNITADDKGHGHYERIDQVISLSGPDSIVGRSIVIHEKADDLKTQPTGNSGARVACGVIVSAD